jgi:hypothetical protein
MPDLTLEDSASILTPNVVGDTNRHILSRFERPHDPFVAIMQDSMPREEHKYTGVSDRHGGHRRLPAPGARFVCAIKCVCLGGTDFDHVDRNAVDRGWQPLGLWDLSGWTFPTHVHTNTRLSFNPRPLSPALTPENPNNAWQLPQSLGDLLHSLGKVFVHGSPHPLMLRVRCEPFTDMPKDAKIP